MLSPLNRTGIVGAGLACALLIAGCCRPVLAEELSPGAEAGKLAEEAMRKAGGNDWESFGAWSRSVIDRAGQLREPAQRIADRIDKLVH
ncbi:MAG: hypothetical protein F4233_03745, partial [Rhodospirillaceae bacterium]|nr:hypothetical protein [Rhodospirillaceae bacterium]